METCTNQSMTCSKVYTIINKCYICLFVSISVNCVHLEAVNDLTIQSISSWVQKIEDVNHVTLVQ